MTKQKSTKRALLMSALALVMCLSMLIGSTFAWFTDSASTGSNVIQAGTLDIVLEYWDGEKWADAEGVTLDFKKASTSAGTEVLWEPGCTYELPKIRVRNEGNLAAYVVLKLNGITGDEKLMEAIELTTKVENIPETILNVSQSRNYEKFLGAPVGVLYGTPDGTVIFDWSLMGKGQVSPNSGHTDTSAEFTISGHMKEEAGNEYQGLKIEGISITALATQQVYEYDSFGRDYDEDATFDTYIELEAGEDLLAAMASAEAGMPLTIKLNGDVEWPTTGTHGENDITPASSILIDGNGYTITATGSGVTPLGDTEAPMTLKNVKIVDKSVSYAEESWEFSYLEMGGKVLNCVNVEFADPIMVDSETATFTDCSFIGYTDSANSLSMYGVWMENGDATFTNCTFTGTRGMKICDMYDPEVGTVVIDGCTFSNLTEKPGVAIDDEDTQDMNITIKNSTFINCQPGDQGLYIYETDNTIPTVENNVVESYTSVVEIATKEELFAFANRVNGGDGMSKVLVKLTANIDLAGEEWTPIGQTGTSYGATTYFQGIFDGQGYTISNMTITETNEGEHYAAGFFGFIDAADVTIRNVNFDKATVKGHHWTGVVAGYLTGNIEKCNVTNSTVTCTHANDNACGDKAGAVVGYVNSGLVNNCSVSDTTVSAGRDAGQVVGASKTTYVANCTASNVTVSATDGCTGANIRNDIIGRILD